MLTSTPDQPLFNVVIAGDRLSKDVQQALVGLRKAAAKALVALTDDMKGVGTFLELDCCASLNQVRLPT